MAHARSAPVVVNVADLLKQLQSATSQTRPPQNVVISGQGPVVTQHNSVMLRGASSSTPSQNVLGDVSYSYKVKIINPTKKSDVIVRHLNNYTSKFDSVVALRLKLMEAFSDQVPNTVDFSVGYYEGSQQSKVWLVTPEDLQKMYDSIKRGHITLWCDQRVTESDTTGRKRKRESESTLREEKEEEVDRVYTELVNKHGKSEYSIPLLRLWARAIATDHHDDYDDPPDWPQFKSQATSAPKKKRQDSLSDALTGAAKVFAEAFSGNKHGAPSSSSVPQLSQSQASSTCISPTKTVDLRMKNYEQLRYLQQLYEDGILCEKEYTEQKTNILGFLRNLK